MERVRNLDSAIGEERVNTQDSASSRERDTSSDSNKFTDRISTNESTKETEWLDRMLADRAMRKQNRRMFQLSNAIAVIGNYENKKSTNGT